MSEIKKTESITTRKCSVCDGPTENEEQCLCNECKRTVLIVRTVLALMEKDGLCFLTGFGNVEKEVKTINV